MKKLILYIVSAILLFLLPFCNSEEEEKFFYFDFDPDLVVQSNDSLYFDLDRDGEDDLGAYVGKFESKINRQFPRFIALNSNTFIDWGGGGKRNAFTNRIQSQCLRKIFLEN